MHDAVVGANDHVKRNTRAIGDPAIDADPVTLVYGEFEGAGGTPIGSSSSIGQSLARRFTVGKWYTVGDITAYEWGGSGIGLHVPIATAIFDFGAIAALALEAPQPAIGDVPIAAAPGIQRVAVTRVVAEEPVAAATVGADR